MKGINLFLLCLLVACSSTPEASWEPFSLENDSRAPETIREVMLASLPNMRQCHATKLSRAPSSDFPAVWEVILRITPEGEVQEERIENSPGSYHEFENCILAVIKDMRFTPVRDTRSVEVRQPLNFARGET